MGNKSGEFRPSYEQSSRIETVANSLRLLTSVLDFMGLTESVNEGPVENYDNLNTTEFNADTYTQQVLPGNSPEIVQQEQESEVDLVVAHVHELIEKAKQQNSGTIDEI